MPPSPAPSTHQFRSWSEKAERLTVALLVLFLLGGAAYSWRLGNTLRFLPDEREYLTLADNLVTYHRYTLDGATLTAYRPPGYVWFLTLLRAAGLRVWQLRLANFLLFVLTLWGLYRWLKRDHSSLAGAFAVWMAGAYVVLFFTAGTLYPQTLAACLLLWSLYLLSAPSPQPARGIFAGALFGWTVLTVPLLGIVLPVALLWGGYFRLPWRRLAAFALVSLLPVALWSARNSRVFGAFVFISTNSGENLLVGNNENATPNSGTTVDISTYRQTASALDEVSRDRYYRRQAWVYIRQHPLSALRLYLLKVLTYFHYRNNLVTTSETSTLRDVVMLLTYAPLLLLGAWRLVAAWRFPLRPLDWLWGGIYVASAFATALFFPRIRFRLPFDYFLISLDAAFLARWLEMKVR